MIKNKYRLQEQPVAKQEKIEDVKPKQELKGFTYTTEDGETVSACLTYDIVD